VANTASSLTHTSTTYSVRSVKDIAFLRLVTGGILIGVAILGVLGGDWDIQWQCGYWT